MAGHWADEGGPFTIDLDREDRPNRRTMITITDGDSDTSIVIQPIDAEWLLATLPDVIAKARAAESAAADSS